MKKLISMTAFVLEQGGNPLQSDTEAWIKTHNYAEFLSKTLNISMFVPAKLVDGEGVVLELPIFKGDSSSHWLDNQEYLLAKSNVLFEGFEIEQDSFINDSRERYIKKDKIKFGWNYNNTNWNFYFQFKTIEDLVKYELTLQKNK